jgi:Peptidase propeptide and YPEB domain
MTRGCEWTKAARSADVQPGHLRRLVVRPLPALMTALLMAAAMTGAAEAQMRQSRGFGGGFGGGYGGPPHQFRGEPLRGPMPYRPLPPGPNRPPPPRGNSLGADWREQQDEARQGVRGGQLAPLGRVIQQIGRRTPGRQLDTGIEYRGDRPVYRVRWITDHGRRVDYMVDAATGAILSEGR